VAVRRKSHLGLGHQAFSQKAVSMRMLVGQNMKTEVNRKKRKMKNHKKNHLIKISNEVI
jgi:hypothetical protein